MKTQTEGGKRRARNPLLRSLRYLGRYRWTALAAFVSLLISTVTMLAVPILFQILIDDGIHARDYDVILRVALALVGVSLVRGLFDFAHGYLGERASQGVAYDLRNALFQKIQRLSFSYHDRAQTGQLMTRATSDVEQLRLFIARGLLMALNAVILILLTGAIIFALNWRLALVMLPILPLALVMFIVFGSLIQPAFRRVQERLEVFNTILQENLTGIRVVKAFAREEDEARRFHTANLALMRQSLRVSALMAFMFPFVFLVSELGQTAITWVGGNFVIEGTLAVGELVAFSSYLLIAFFPIGQLGMIIAMAGQAAASGGRIFEILDAQSEVADRPGAVPLGQVRGRVEFHSVTFRYFSSGEPVLDRVSFVAEPGQTVALLGATGSGKSTIINLIPRFYDVTDGAVRIDGIDVRDVTLDSLRRQIGIVLQETRLFAGTIRDNIAFGRPDATQEQIEAVARAAAAHDFITAFPQGYDTPVGERGVTLSGGQKQRIAIARALLLDPRILILDDSTSSVDLQTELAIQQALDRLMQGRTSFVIAQRISTVLNADQIIVLDRGRVAAIGTHEALLEASEIYADIYQSQLVDDVAADAATTPDAQKSEVLP